MPQINQLIVPEESAGLRLDRFLAVSFEEYSRSYLTRIIDNGRVTRNGATARKRDNVATGDEVAVDWPPPEQLQLDPEAIDLPILYEDEDILVIDKPADLVVHPGAGTQSGTLVNALLGYDYQNFTEMADDVRPGIVHRLDKDTSGVMIVARNPIARDRLSTAFAERQVEKIYLAITAGAPDADSGEARSSIGRHPKHRKKMAVVERNGKNAVTLWNVLSRSAEAALLRVQLKTGRTHQIRVHLAHEKLPIVGDDLYGNSGCTLEAPRQMLHAWRLGIRHPRTKELLAFAAPVPDDFVAVARCLGLEPPE
ncbi:MAG: RluA family pseudouridine synthase [Lentisphaeria bacterium]